MGTGSKQDNLVTMVTKFGTLFLRAKRCNGQDRNSLLSNNTCGHCPRTPYQMKFSVWLMLDMYSFPPTSWKCRATKRGRYVWTVCRDTTTHIRLSDINGSFGSADLHRVAQL